MARSPLTYPSFKIPACSVCETRCVKDVSGRFFCPNCADDWLKSYVDAKTGDRSLGGVQLPYGVSDERKQTPSFGQMLPNRRTRRALARAR